MPYDLARMTQSLRLLDLVINRGQSARHLRLSHFADAAEPAGGDRAIAFFGAALYALNRLNADSELVVMWSAGISRLQIALPCLPRRRSPWRSPMVAACI